MEILLMLVIIVGAIIYDALIWGLVVQKFWGWFLVPVFPEMLNPISFELAVGLAFFIGLFHARNYTSIKSQYKDGTTEVVTMLIAPWLTLLIGTIVYGFIS
jgi:hypothetical protein